MGQDINSTRANPFILVKAQLWQGNDLIVGNHKVGKNPKKRTPVQDGSSLTSRLVGRVGLEPTTQRLKAACSTD